MQSIETRPIKAPLHLYTRPNIAECPAPSLLSLPLSSLCPSAVSSTSRASCFPGWILKKRLPPALAWWSSCTDLKKHFLSPPYSLSVEAGRNAELRCTPPLGVPQPKVYWLKNGSPLETIAGSTPASSDSIPNDVTGASNFVQTGDGHLILGKAELRHQGNYSCVAENIAARRVSEPAVLTVYGETFADSVGSWWISHQIWT